MAGTFTDTFNVFAVDKVEKMMGGEKVKVHEKQFDKGKSLIPYSKQISILASWLKTEQGTILTLNNK